MHKLMILAGLLVAGCGSERPQEPAEGRSTPPVSETTASAASSSACNILTQADAEAALDHPVSRRTDAGGGGLHICRYGYEGEAMDRGNVSVTVQPVDIATLKQAVTASGTVFEPVPGLGDEAYYSREAGLYVGKGSRTAIYRLGKGGLSDAREATIALARATAGKL